MYFANPVVYLLMYSFIEYLLLLCNMVKYISGLCFIGTLCKEELRLNR